MRRILPALLLSFPRLASACAVCFGAESPDLAKGFYWGVLLLLVLPPAMVLGLALLIARHSRRARRGQAGST